MDFSKYHLTYTRTILNNKTKLGKHWKNHRKRNPSKKIWERDQELL